MGESLKEKAERLAEYQCEHEGPHLTISCLREDAAEVARAYLALVNRCVSTGHDDPYIRIRITLPFDAAREMLAGGDFREVIAYIAESQFRDVITRALEGQPITAISRSSLDAYNGPPDPTP